MKLDRAYLHIGFLYALAGLVLGIVMASSQNHGQHVTHAHILLIGFVVSFVYAVVTRLWVAGPAGTLAKIQFGFHQVGVLALVVGLFLMYGGHAAPSSLEPLLGGGSVAVLVAMVMMWVMVMRAPANARAPVTENA